MTVPTLSYVDPSLWEQQMQSDPAMRRIIENDAPVEDEGHYRFLLGRLERFARRRVRVDTNGVSLDERSAKIEIALRAWDRVLPLSTLREYESRILLVKQLLRSPWQLGGPYPTRAKFNVKFTTMLHPYREAQYELRWLKERVRRIYQARCRRKTPTSPTVPSTAA